MQDAHPTTTTLDQSAEAPDRMLRPVDWYRVGGAIRRLAVITTCAHLRQERTDMNGGLIPPARHAPGGDRMHNSEGNRL